MKERLIYLIVVVLFVLGIFSVVSQAGHAPLDKQEIWRLGVQAWSFKSFTFAEAVEKTARLGLSYIEAYPGQKLSKEKPQARFSHDMSSQDRQYVREILGRAGIKLTNYGVVGLGNNESQCRKIFAFAREMGIETIVSEPPEDALDLIEKLCDEYKINLAIHNHPKPSRYWNPDTVLKVCRGRSPRIGACADTGHWMRSGIEPLRAIKKLKRRIITLHLKDINGLGEPSLHDVVWGTGKGAIEKQLAQLKQQGFSGVFSIEYEHNWKNSMPDIAQCIDFFDKEAASLGRSSWRWIFNGYDLTGWQAKPNSWKVEKGGVLAAVGGGDIWSEKQYGNFILDMEFRLSPRANSGVFLRTGDLIKWLHTAIEVQILDSYGKKIVNKHDCGAVFDCLEPSENAVKKPGAWNHYSILCQENMIIVILNGNPVTVMDLNQWTQAHKNPDGTRNKFNTAYRDMPRQGYLGLQYHGHPVWFRNIKIKDLDSVQ